MYKWANKDRTCVIRLSDGAAIPCTIGNADYQRFLEWCHGYRRITKWDGPKLPDGRLDPNANHTPVEWVEIPAQGNPLPADEDKKK
jgi:hypothetical protein